MNIFWLDILIFILNVHIISIRVLGGKLYIRGLVFSLSLVLPCAALTFLNTGSHLGDILIICVTLLGYASPLFTLKEIKKIKILYVSLLYAGASNALVVAFAWLLLTADIKIKTIVDIIFQCVLLALCVIFSKNSVFHRAKQYIELISTRLKVLLLTSIWIGTLFALFFSSYISSAPPTILSFLISFLAIGLIMSIVLMWPFILISSAMNASYQAALEILDGQIQAQVKQYELAVQANEDIREFKHDFQNLKIGLTNYLRNYDTGGALRFLEECEQSIRSEYIAYKTGNPIADALLSEKQALAEPNNIKIDFDGIILSDALSSFDLCVILGNILDNALEACAALPVEEAKTISVFSQANNGFLFITVSNPVKTNLIIRSNTLGTSKKEQKNHGIGLMSIRNTVQKYCGTMKLSCADNIFVTEIILDFNFVQTG